MNQRADRDAPPSYARATPKHLEPPSDRSGTGTPITARVAAEVADSAELLHEGVPEREKEQDNSKGPEIAAEDTNTAKTLDNDRHQVGSLFSFSGGQQLKITEHHFHPRSAAGRAAPC